MVRRSAAMCVCPFSICSCPFMEIKSLQQAKAYVQIAQGFSLMLAALRGWTADRKAQLRQDVIYPARLLAADSAGGM